MKITEAFAKFCAKQTNIQWSVSSFSPDGELVVSLWDQFFEKRSKNTMTYVDRVTRWNGLGNKEFRRNIDHAYRNNIKVRAIIAKTKRPDVVEAGGAASSLGNTFHPKEKWIGDIILWNGDDFEIEFKSE